MRRTVSTLIGFVAMACGSPQVVVTDPPPMLHLSPSEIHVDGYAPPGSRGLVLSDSLVTCVGDDSQKQVICVIGTSWNTARRFGREGQGPQEFRSTYELGAGSSGSVVVSDIGNRRLTWLDPGTGSFIKTHSVPLFFRQSAPEQGGVVLGAAQIPSPNFESAPLSLNLVAINSVSGRQEWEREFVVPESARDEKVRMLMSKGWTLPDGRVGAMVSQSEIGYWTAAGEYLGSFVSPAYIPRTRTEAEAVAFWEGLKRGSARFGGPIRDSAQTVREAMESTVPAYQGDPKLGPEGTVWFLSNGNGASAQTQFEVFRGLEYVGRVDVSVRVHEFDIRGNIMVVLRDSGTVDEFGFEQRDLMFFDIVIPPS